MEKWGVACESQHYLGHCMPTLSGRGFAYSSPAQLFYLCQAHMLSACSCAAVLRTSHLICPPDVFHIPLNYMDVTPVLGQTCTWSEPSLAELAFWYALWHTWWNHEHCQEWPQSALADVSQPERSTGILGGIWEWLMLLILEILYWQFRDNLLLWSQLAINFKPVSKNKNSSFVSIHQSNQANSLFTNKEQFLEIQWIIPSVVLQQPAHFFKWTQLLLQLTCAIDRAGMHLTVVTPASSKCAAALLQGDMASQHALTQVLIVQIMVAFLTLHWWCWKIIEGKEGEKNEQTAVFKDQMGNCLAQWLLLILEMGACLPPCYITFSFKNSQKAFGNSGYKFWKWNSFTLLPDILVFCAS